jgi:hypothetical protein
LNLSSLADIKTSAIKDNLTCLVIVSNPAEETVINKKDGQTLKKISMKVHDNSATQVDVIAWGDSGNELMKYSPNEVLLLKNVSIKEWQTSFHLKFDTNSRISKELEGIDQQITNSFLKFRNQHQNDPSKLELNDISSLGEVKSGSKSILYSIQSIQADAEE